MPSHSGANSECFKGVRAAEEESFNIAPDDIKVKSVFIYLNSSANAAN